MDELKELGTTLILGSLALVLAELVLYGVFGARLTGFFERPLGVHKKRDAQVFLFLCFAVGLCFEDVLHKSPDAIDLGGLPRRLLANNFLFDDVASEASDLTRRRLVTVVLVHGLQTKSPKTTALAKEMAANGLFPEIDQRNLRGAFVQQWLTTPRPVDPKTQEEIEESIQRVWYEAKNRVYQEEGYRDELERIETRQRFTLTIAETAHYLWYVALIGGIFVAAGLGAITRIPQTVQVRKILPRHPRGLVAWCVRAHKNAAAIGSYILCRVVVCVAIVYAVYIFGLWSHTRESLEFNKRVFGYYNSLVFETAHPIANPEHKDPKKPDER